MTYFKCLFSSQAVDLSLSKPMTLGHKSNFSGHRLISGLNTHLKGSHSIHMSSGIEQTIFSVFSIRLKYIALKRFSTVIFLFFFFIFLHYAKISESLTAYVIHWS